MTRRFFRIAAAAISLVVALACAPPAFALQTDEPLFHVTGQADIELSCIDVRPLPVASDPSTLPVGRACGMEGMCGQDPCLCGSADEWGVCACNGIADDPPRFSLDCKTPGVVRLVYLFGQPMLVTFGQGETDAVVTASYDWHGSSSMDVHVSAAAFGPLDALKIAVALAAVAGITVVVVVVARAIAAKMGGTAGDYR